MNGNDEREEASALVCVRTFGSVVEAEVVRGLLESSGIQAAVTTDDCDGWQPALQVGAGVGLLVRREDAEEAEAILQNLARDRSSDD